MLKRTLVALTAFALLTVGTSHAQEWTFDKSHSYVGFKVSHLVISNTKGNFKEFDGKVVFDGKNFEEASVEITIDVASIDTDNADRDNHLRSPDFFEVEKFPTMTFKSTRVVKGEGNNFQIIGNLTMKGVTKEVTLDAEFLGALDMGDKSKAGFTASTTINREDFGVDWNRPLDGGGLVVGKEVEILLEIEVDSV